MTWQTERAKTRQPYLPKLVVRPGTPCKGCDHPRSSHSLLTLQARCKADDCTCPCFEPLCGCGHLLCEHTWGTPPHPWECCRCPCARFGADMTGERVYEPDLFPRPPIALGPPPVEPAVEPPKITYEQPMML
jgi:hypothetical protein